jgi:hypothetical protein
VANLGKGAKAFIQYKDDTKTKFTLTSLWRGRDDDKFGLVYILETNGEHIANNPDIQFK